MVEEDSEQKKKSKKKKKSHTKHGKRKHQMCGGDKSEKGSDKNEKNDNMQSSTPAENERVQTHMRQGDADLMAAAIQQVTAQTTPEAQEQVAAALAQNMTEE